MGEPFHRLRVALEAAANSAADRRGGPTEPARARTDARDGLEVRTEARRITFPAVCTSHPTPPYQPEAPR